MIGGSPQKKEATAPQIAARISVTFFMFFSPLRYSTVTQLPGY